MRPELIVEERDGRRWAALVSGRTLIDLAIDSLDAPCLYQSIWRARIDRIVPHVGAFAVLDHARSGLFREGDRRSGDSVIAQIKSRRSEGKADILTSDIALGGRYFVYLPYGQKLAISRKSDAQAVAGVVAALSESGITTGIVRAASLKAPLAAVVAEAMQLRDRWQAIEERSGAGLLQEGPGAPDRLRLDYPHYDLTPIFDSFDSRGLGEQIDALTQPVVKLPGGGSIVIERTAALTAIDVNAATQPPPKADREALDLIAAQIRLRNLSGLIVIDFAAPPVLDDMRRAMADDPAGPRVLGVTPAGLVEVTRPARDLPLAEKLARIM